MKKLITITLLIAFFWQNSGTLCVLVSFYIQRDYIAQNLCVNRFEKIPVCKGSCYLVKELKNAEKQEKKLPNLTQKEIQLFFKHEYSATSKLSIKIEKNNPSFYKPNLTSSSVLYTIDHPPETV